MASIPSIFLFQRSTRSDQISIGAAPTLHFQGFQITSTNRIAVFTVTNCTSREMLLSGFDKEANINQGWAPIDAVYGDTWWVYRGRQSLGNPKIAPGADLTLYAIAPSAPKWRLKLDSCFRVSAWKEWNWRLTRAWKVRNPLEFWRGSLYAGRAGLSSIELAGE